MRIREYQSKTQRYLSLVTKVDGKLKTIFSIGNINKLKNGIPHPKKFFSDLLNSILNYLSDLPLEANDKSRVRNLGYIYIEKILEDLGMDELFKDIQKSLKIGYVLYKIFSILVICRIIDPGSIRSENKEAYKYFYPDYTLADYYRSLNYIAENNERIQKHLYRRNSGQDQAMVALYFDGSNVYYETDKEDADTFDEEGNLIRRGLRTKGFSKENRPNPIVNIGLISYSDGIPVALEVYPGKEHEKTHLAPLLEYLMKNYDLKDFELIADRGLYSQNIIGCIQRVAVEDGESEKYIIGLPLRNASKKVKEFAADPGNFSYFLYRKGDGKDSVFKYKIIKLERLITYKIDDKEYKKRVPQEVLIYYSHKFAKRERIKRQEKITKALRAIKDSSLYANLSHTNVKSLIQEIHFISETGEIADKRKLVLDLEKIENQEKLDGLYGIVTNDFKLMPRMIYNVYRRLWISEQNFRILKSELKIRPVFLRRSDHVLAHMIISIISLEVVRILQNLLKEAYSPGEIIRSLKDFIAVEITEGSYYIPDTNLVIEKLRKITGIGYTKRFAKL